MKMNLNRRQFIRTTALGAGVAAFSTSAWSQVPGANDDIRVAVVGINGQGRSHLNEIQKLPGVRLAAVCDVDQAVLDRELKKLKEKNPALKSYRDIRKLLEDKEIDAITIATPNHWHSLAAIWAVQAGKDVYVEKPVSHNVWEGRQLVNAARKYNKIVQTGTQSRSNTGMREAVAYLQKGELGKINLVRGLCYKRRASIGKVSGPQQPPESVDYDLWCGPAPKDPLMRAKLHYDWHWVWPTGNGDLGNQGIHQMDIARWILDEPELSPRVFSIGGRLGYEDDGTTPNTQIIFHEYKKAPLIFEVRGLPTDPASNKMDLLKGASIGVIAECENGYMVIPSYHSATVHDKDGNVVKKFEGQASHHANFIKAVRSRKTADLNADILEGHLSSALCHTGNISYLLGSKESPETILEKIKGHSVAQETFGRMAEHLKTNLVDTAATKLTFGEFLEMDGKKELFTNLKKANPLLTREYRKGYEVPNFSVA